MRQFSSYFSRTERYKILLLGDYDVGKTAFAYREYVQRGLFHDEHKKDLTIAPGEVCNVKLIDSWVPQTSYDDIDDELLVPCDGYILMYAVNSMSTFQDLCRAARQIPLNSKKNSKLNLILVGTKSDDKFEREVSYQDGFGLSKQLGCSAFFEVSAKTSDYVDEAVVELVRSIKSKKRARRYPWTRLFRLLATSKSLGNNLQVKVSKPMRVMLISILDVWREIIIATQPDTKIGRRGSQLSISPLKILGESLDIPVYTIPHRKPEFKTWKLPPPFSDFTPSDASDSPPRENILITASFGRILSKVHLDMFAKDRRLNVHPSLLPDYRGPAPIQHALLDGREKTGVCIIEMLKKSEGIDAGRIWEKEEAVIHPDDTFITLRDRLAIQGGDLLVKSLRNMLDDSAVCLPQASAENAPAAPFITAAHAVLDFQKLRASDITLRHRAISHQKPIFTYTPNGAEVQFHEVSELLPHLVSDDPSTTGKIPDQQPGSAVYNNPNKCVLVRCGDGSILRVTSLQSEGKKMLNAQQWWNGTKEGKEGRPLVFGSPLQPKL
ncbi:hypothetical protein CVT24_013008 [Panaeolus cyanescens]|uniref:methionyl-tRNA formyltransferase n=1 Tax=Panaeolus cyanescens TaxID=181874 RepID=A0A409VVQ2_9AGAR|nr:hypothetical protein CVT24_013008 [Panaeolus cyanescens]